MGFNLRRRRAKEEAHKETPIGRGYMDFDALMQMTMESLRKLAKDLNVPKYANYTKKDLAEIICKIPVDINKSDN
jgi:hypothetical protein